MFDWLTGGVGSLLGGVVSGIGSIFGANQQNQANMQMLQSQQNFNAQQTQQQEAFQERMSNTAYQRASSDMKAAGLNPMMMFGSGGAASSPGGAAASSGTAPMTSGLGAAGGAIAQGVNSAVSNQVAMKQIDKIAEEIALIKNQAVTEAARPGLVISQAHKAEAESDVTRQELAPATLRSETAKILIPMLNTALGQTAVKADWAGGKVSGAIRPLMDAFSSAAGMKRAFNPVAARWPD